MVSRRRRAGKGGDCEPGLVDTAPPLVPTAGRCRVTAPGGGPLFVHLSDIHFDAATNTVKGPNRLVREALLDDLALGAQQIGRKPDAVLVSGDIAFSGRKEQYEQAREFLASVTGTLGIEPEKVLAIPGNHDVDRRQVVGSVKASRDALRAKSPLEADKALPEYLEQDPTDPLFAPLAAYNQFALAYGCSVSGRAPYWEFPWPLDAGHVLRLRGLTTVLVSDGDDRKANLLVGSDQTTLVTPARNDVIMVMGHHPPDWWMDEDECETYMKGYASVHLYGHKHRHRLSVLDDSVRLSAGAVHPERETDWEPRYNWLQLEFVGVGTTTPELAVKVWPRVVSMNDNAFRSGSHDGGWQPDVRKVPLPRLAGPARPVGVPAEPSPEPAGGLQHAASVLAAARREPVSDASGTPTPLRRAVYRFGLLGYRSQTRVLSGLGLIADEDKDLPVEERFRAAFSRAQERGLVDNLVSAIDAAGGAADGPQ